MNSISEPLFHLLISSFNVSMNSFPVFPKGTKNVLLRHLDISSWAFSIVDTLTIIDLPSSSWPQTNEDGVGSVLHSGSDPGTSSDNLSRFD